MKADCKKFQDKHQERILNSCLCSDKPLEQAGHDFWLTRNGHGAGFWETGDWTEEAGRILTDASKGFKESHLCIGDDGKIHSI
jgi:hypothetical protein